MKSLSLVTIISVVTLAAVSTTMAGEPRMIDAINALRRAKTSAEPSKDLHLALDNLRRASKNKAGYRGEAIQIVEKIIATNPSKIDFDRMVDEAIDKCEKGAAAGFKPIGRKHR